MEMLQEIGSYAGFAAVVGLAVLSALYFSQARDVKRLREWAGRAPERAPVPVETRRVVAQPVPKPPQSAGAVQAPPVPRPPGAQPPTAPQPAVAQSAAGAAPAVVQGPPVATPAAAAQAAGAPDATEEGSEPEEEAPTAAVNGDAGLDAPAVADRDGSSEEVREEDAAEGEEERAGDAPGDGEEREADREAPAVVHQETDEWDPVESGEWRPEDEHSDIELEREEEPRELRPPAAPRPYRPPPVRPRAPLAAPGAGRGPGVEARRGQIIPPYSQSRPQADPAREGNSRRTALVVGGVVLALAIAVFAVVQVTGDEEPTSPLQSELQNAPEDGADSPEREAPPIDPSTVTVAVLNGTLVPGLAKQMGDELRAQEFQVGTVTNNFDQERAESVVLYAPGAEREAADVGRRLDIAQREAIDPDSQALAGDASVVVVTGADLTQ